MRSLRFALYSAGLFISSESGSQSGDIIRANKTFLAAFDTKLGDLWHSFGV